ncbi:hypothetical protein BDV97DRAFT_216954 [Delphinella strobiligena]|nr:hypothetical protein BDV97DRAFT_216954 [Delphinella strobiligena]
MFHAALYVRTDEAVLWVWSSQVRNLLRMPPYRDNVNGLHNTCQRKFRVTGELCQSDLCASNDAHARSLVTIAYTKSPCRWRNSSNDPHCSACSFPQKAVLKSFSDTPARDGGRTAVYDNVDNDSQTRQFGWQNSSKASSHTVPKGGVTTVLTRET